jgi:hypothetical protein
MTFAPKAPPFYGPRVRLGSSLAFAAVAAAALASARARADTPAPPPPPPPPADEIDPDAGVPKPLAPDWRTGHVLLSGRYGLLTPTGNAAVVGSQIVEEGIAVGDLSTAGMVFGGTLGIGVTRHGVVEAVVDYGRLGAPSGCSGCNGHQLAIGLGVSYHMAQGIALDPWVSYGLGFRFSTFRVLDIVTNKVESQEYRGIDVARLALGADFYPLSFVGLGPYIESDIGTNVKFPKADYRGSVYAMFQLGVRLTFDPLRATTRSGKRAAGLGLAPGF